MAREFQHLQLRLLRLMTPEYIYAVCPECHVPARSKVAADPARWSALRHLFTHTVAYCPQCQRTIVLATAVLVSHCAAPVVPGSNPAR